MDLESARPTAPQARFRGLASFHQSAALSRVLNGAPDHTCSGPTRAGWRRLFHRRLDIAPHEWTVQIALALEFDVAHGLAVAFEHTIRIGQRGAARES